MSVSSVTAPSSSTQANLTGQSTTTSSTTNPSQTLTPSDFMQLLTIQLQNQDPTQPMDANQQMQQIVQISSMQNMQTMSSSLTSMGASQTWSLANSYLGRQVTLTDPKTSTAVNGQVTAIDTSGTSPQIQVNGTYYPISSVTNIQLPATSVPAATTSPTPTTG